MNFSTELQCDITAALSISNDGGAQPSDAELAALAERACREAKAARVGMQEMLAALNAVILAIPPAARNGIMRIALEQRMISTCVVVCFG